MISVGVHSTLQYEIYFGRWDQGLLSTAHPNAPSLFFAEDEIFRTESINLKKKNLPFWEIFREKLEGIGNLPEASPRLRRFFFF